MLKKVAIFCGGPSSEFEVSLNSARTIFQNLDKSKYEVYYFFISKDLKAKFLLGTDNVDFKKIKPAQPLITALEDFKEKNAFALLAGIHGEFVEDGKLQTLLETLNIPYSGSDSKGSMLAMDKYLSCLIAKEVKRLTIPKTHLLTATKYLKDYEYPVLVKPNELGSSIGVYIATDKDELIKILAILRSHLKVSNVLVQEYLKGAIEISCGCLQKKDWDFTKLPPIEIKPKAELFDYASKYEIGGSEEITPPVSISEKLADEISSITCELHNLLGLKTYSRSDFLVKGDKIYYLETNTLPGMTATSLLPQEASAIGITFPELLDFLIENS